VTRAAHCMIAPYWAERLGKTEIRAFQASRRGGEVLCRLAGERVELTGACVFYTWRERSRSEAPSDFVASMVRTSSQSLSGPR